MILPVTLETISLESKGGDTFFVKTFAFPFVKYFSTLIKTLKQKVKRNVCYLIPVVFFCEP